MLIAMDHGNKQMKTAHKSFPSGLSVSDTRPPFGKDILLYNGKYYTLSEKRIPYMRDKTLDEQFFILTLFGIGFEMEAADQTGSRETTDVQLAIGLPPAHYGSQYERFERYFMNRGTIQFHINGNPCSIRIDDVVAFPQAYAAAMPALLQIREQAKIMVVDIGGFTADYLQLKKGQPDLGICDSLEHGVILLYNDIIRKVNADFDILLEESDIDAILNGATPALPKEIADIVRAKAQAFVNELIGILRERGIDLRVCKTIWAGGGSLLLRKWIEANLKVGNGTFIEDIAANVRGYEMLYRAARRR